MHRLQYIPHSSPVFEPSCYYADNVEYNAFTLNFKTTYSVDSGIINTYTPSTISSSTLSSKNQSQT